MKTMHSFITMLGQPACAALLALTFVTDAVASEFSVYGGHAHTAGSCASFEPVSSTGAHSANASRMWFVEDVPVVGNLGGSFSSSASPGGLYSRVQCFDDRNRGNTYCVQIRGEARMTLTNVVFTNPEGVTGPQTIPVSFSANLRAQTSGNGSYSVTGTLPVISTSPVGTSPNLYRVESDEATFTTGVPYTFEFVVSTHSSAESLVGTTHYSSSSAQLTFGLGETVFNVPPGYNVTASGFIEGNRFVAPAITAVVPGVGPEGRVVVIQGANLGTATSVTFNGVPATVTANSDTEITTTVPVGATTGPIAVTTASGTAESPEPFVVSPLNAVIDTIAGSGTAGFSGDGGPALAAALGAISSSAVGPDGSVYFVDSNGLRIRRVDPAGNISTFAGTGNFSFSSAPDNTVATEASFRGIGGIAFDPVHIRLYLTDSSNNRVRFVNEFGRLWTLAGNGSSFSSGDGGPGPAAGVARPAGIAVDSSSNVYIVESFGSAVRKVAVAPNGDTVISTIASGLSSPSRVTADAAGNAFIVERVSSEPVRYIVRRVDALTQALTTVAGGGTDAPVSGPATSALLSDVADIAVKPEGTTLYLNDHDRLLAVDLASGLISVFAGDTYGFAGDGGPAILAKFARPSGLSAASGDRLFVSDSENYRVRRIGPPLGVAPTVTLAAATGITAAGATLHGTVNPGGLATTAQFQYGIATNYGTAAAVTLSPADGTSDQTVSAVLTGLAAHTEYHFRLTATNSAGTANSADGTFMTTNTPPSAPDAAVSATTGDQQTITLPFPATDADGDAVTMTSVTPGAHLTVNSTSGAEVTFTPAADYAGPATLDYEVSDGFGGTDAGTIAVTISDNDAPVIASHAEVIAEATSAAGARVNYAAAAASDNIGVASLTYSKASGAIFPRGTTTVTITAADAANNTSTGTFTVTVQDTTPPAITPPANVMVPATISTGAVVHYAPATAFDAVGVTTLTYSRNSGTGFPIGTTTVTITARDAANNTGTGTFTVTVTPYSGTAVSAMMYSPVVPPSGNDVGGFATAYRTAEEVFGEYPGAGSTVLIKDAVLQLYYLDSLAQEGPNEHARFLSSEFRGLMSINGGPDTPFSASGPVETLTMGKAGNTTGTFETEMRSMSLSGGSLMIRESPTLPSLGMTAITDMGGGQFRVESFFDVFTELSVDGGATWMPSNGPTRIQFQQLAVPRIVVEQPSGTVRTNGSSVAFVGSNADLVFTVRNTGLASLNLTGTPERVTIGGADAAQFSVTVQPAATVDGLDSTTFTVRFTPSSPGLKTAALYVFSDDPNVSLFTLTLTGQTNAAPSAITFADNVSSLLEDTNTASAIKVADIVVTDDGFGTNTLSLSGADAARFSIVGSELFLKAGTVLDFETRSIFVVSVDADDPTIAGTPDAGAVFSLSINDVAEAGKEMLGVGSNGNGSLGVGRGTPYSDVLAAVPLGGTRLVEVAAGSSSGIGRSASGGLFAWGRSSAALFGTATGDPTAPTPVLMTGALEGRTAVAVAASISSFYAVLDNGRVVAWGSNGSGQLGNNTTTASVTPVEIHNLSDVVAISAGGGRPLALKGDGTVVIWGGGVSASAIVPAAVSGLSNVSAVAASSAHRLALMADGTVRAWGANSKGQLGINSTAASQASPALVAGLSSVTQIAAGAEHSVALRDDGTVWTWGAGDKGQLGDGLGQMSRAPVQVPGIAGAVEIAANGGHTLVRLADGSVRAFGNNTNGELGDGTKLNRFSPVAVGGIANCTAIDGATDKSFFLTEDGSTGAPTLIAPAAASTFASSLAVNFTLPEPAGSGTVKLIFDGPANVTVTLASARETAGSHRFSLNPDSLSSSSSVASSVGGNNLPQGIYNVTLSYQDVAGNTAATSVATDVLIDSVAPVGGVLRILPKSMASPATPVTLVASGWTDVTPPLSYRFFLNAVPLGDAQPGATFSMSPLSAGSYVARVEVADALGNASVKFATLIVDDEAPVISVPDPITVVATGPTGANVTFAVSATDDNDTSPYLFIQPASGSLFPEGATEVFVSATDDAGNVSTDSFTVTVVAGNAVENLPVVKLTSPAVSTVTGVFDIEGTVKEKAGLASFTVTFNGVEQNLTTDPLAFFVSNTDMAFGVAGVIPENGPNKIVVTAVNVYGRTTTVMKTVNFSNTALANLAGTYQALLVPTSTPDLDTTGLIAVTVTASGTFTGKATLSGVAVSFSGVLDNDGNARFKPALGPTVDLIDTTELDSYLGALAFTIATPGGMTGTLSNEAADGATLLATFAGKVAPYNSSNLVPAEFLTGTGTARYTVALPSKGQTPALALDRYPQGDGFVALTLSTAGNIVLTGFLADGTACAVAGKLRADGTAVFFRQLYRKLGCLGGELSFADNPDSDVSGTDLLWLRPALRRAHFYPEGWDGLRVDAVGTKYVNPASFDFGQGVENTVAGNALLRFTEGLLSSEVQAPVSVRPTNGAVKLIPTNGVSYQFSLATGSGTFSGSFTPTDGRATNYRGILLNKGANKGGFGYFRSTPVLRIGETGQSGHVFLDPDRP
ncbi:MAG: HYR domain-containing protein [Chthoniobacteraceae bacterium]